MMVKKPVRVIFNDIVIQSHDWIKFPDVTDELKIALEMLKLQKSEVQTSKLPTLKNEQI